jgi:sugar phosphate isomerase/epimerase
MWRARSGRVGQALDIIEATGRDEIGLCLDYWNIWQNGDIEADIRRAGDQIFSRISAAEV